jgi:hypothetical protein
VEYAWLSTLRAGQWKLADSIPDAEEEEEEEEEEEAWPCSLEVVETASHAGRGHSSLSASFTTSAQDKGVFCNTRFDKLVNTCQEDGTPPVAPVFEKSNRSRLV